MQQRQYGPNAGVAVPGMLDEEVEAAYKQFGRALGETPRETSKVVRAKYNIPASPLQPAARRVVSPGSPSERCRTCRTFYSVPEVLAWESCSLLIDWGGFVDKRLRQTSAA